MPPLLCRPSTVINLSSLCEKAILTSREFCQLDIIGGITFQDKSPLQYTVLEDFFLVESIRESRKTPVPGPTSRRFSMCRNWSKQNIVSLLGLCKNTMDSSKYITVFYDYSVKYYYTQKPIESRSSKLVQMYLQQLWM